MTKLQSGVGRFADVVSIFTDGSYRVTDLVDVAVESTHEDYVRSLTVGELLYRLQLIEGMADKVLTRTDRKVTPSDYRTVLGFIRSGARSVLEGTALALAAGARGDETAQQAQSEGRQSGPQGQRPNTTLHHPSGDTSNDA